MNNKHFHFSEIMDTTLLILRSIKGCLSSILSEFRSIEADLYKIIITKGKNYSYYNTKFIIYI